MRKLFLALMLMTLVGCAKPFTHNIDPERSTQAQFDRDRYECEMSATQYADNLGFSANPLIIGDQIKKCLKARGWRQ